jgi:thiosulfate/3-mercaptopyruvate sulfurtransferase
MALVSVDWLATQLGAADVRIVDTRWYLTEPSKGHAEYLEAHIPGAIYMDIDHDLSAPKGHGPGRHPLPRALEFASTASRAGIGSQTFVVVYDAVGGAYAARLWWLLRYFGHRQVAVLDGGWPAWVRAGLPTTAAVPTIWPAEFRAIPNTDMVVNADLVEQIRQNPEALLLDARAAERYAGLVEPMDARAGHVPGAISAPFAGNLAPDGTFLPVEELRQRYAELGAGQANTIVCYCGSGVTATHNLLALTLLGYEDGLLYEGSWSDWSADPQRPIAP